MNAYKLADKLESFWLTKNDDLLIKTVTMLRQQADRIAELEKQTKPLSNAEIANLWLLHPSKQFNFPFEFARAIEERHGIK